MSEKINYAWPVTSENAVVYNFFLNKVSEIRSLLKNKTIVIIGAGIRGCCLLKILKRDGYDDIIFADNNPEKQGNLIYEHDIISVSKAVELDKKKVFFVAPENSDKIIEQLCSYGLKKDTDWFSFSCSSYEHYINEYLRPVADHLLIVGDCAFSHIAVNDSNYDSLGVMMKNELGSSGCKVLDMHGMGQRAYYNIIRSLLRRGERPSAVLLLTVLEALAPKASIMPRTQHPQLIKKLVDVSKTDDTEFIEYADIAQKRYDHFQTENFASSEEITASANEKAYMRMNYMFNLRENSEGVEYLIKNIKMMNDECIPVTLYIPPVNIYQGEKLLGAEFKEKYEDNLKKIFQILDKNDLKYKVADASYLLEQSEFADINTIDETSNYKGRQKLLGFLMKCISAD